MKSLFEILSQDYPVTEVVIHLAQATFQCAIETELNILLVTQKDLYTILQL